MDDGKDKQQNKANLDNYKYEMAREIGIVDAGLQGVKETNLGEKQVRDIVSRFRTQIIGFK